MQKARIEKLRTIEACSVKARQLALKDDPTGLMQRLDVDSRQRDQVTAESLELLERSLPIGEHVLVDFFGEPVNGDADPQALDGTCLQKCCNFACDIRSPVTRHERQDPGDILCGSRHRADMIERPGKRCHPLAGH